MSACSWPFSALREGQLWVESSRFCQILPDQRQALKSAMPSKFSASPKGELRSKRLGTRIDPEHGAVDANDK